ncbi:hypothetical protein GF342_05050 [Candidatus Woesearchaeota archaeon]|nr:hypothetical protein [Candidatus Woesearchaeota archaeon]
MSKRANIQNFLVGLAILALSTLALAWLVYLILSWLGIITPDVACEWSTLLIGITKLGTAGMFDVPPECKTVYVNVTMADLEALKYDAEDDMLEIQRQLAGPNRARWEEIAKIFNNPTDEQLQYEWALNKIMADQLRNCWQKVQQGKLPLFDSWWNLIDWDLFGISDPPDDYSKQEKWAVQQYAKGTIPGTSLNLFTAYGPPTFCIYCARVKFSPNVTREVEKTEITSLAAWMRTHPVRPGDEESYWEYVLDETQKETSSTLIKNNIKYTYKINEPFAVEFARMNEWGADAFALPRSVIGKVGELLGYEESTEENKRANRLVLVPAKDSIYPFGTATIAGGDGEQGIRVQCLQQIG